MKSSQNNSTKIPFSAKALSAETGLSGPHSSITKAEAKILLARMKDRLELSLLKKVFNIPLPLSEIVRQDPALYSLDRLPKPTAGSSIDSNQSLVSIASCLHAVPTDAAIATNSAKPPLHPIGKTNLVPGRGCSGAISKRRRRAFSSLQENRPVHHDSSLRPSRSLTSNLPFSSTQPPVLDTESYHFNDSCQHILQPFQHASLKSPPLSAHSLFLPSMTTASPLVETVSPECKQDYMDGSLVGLTSLSTSPSLLPSPLSDHSGAHQHISCLSHCDQQHLPPVHHHVHASWSDAEWIKFFSI